jgi:hypothetical protein
VSKGVKRKSLQATGIVFLVAMKGERNGRKESSEKTGKKDGEERDEERRKEERGVQMQRVRACCIRG